MVAAVTVEVLDRERCETLLRSKTLGRVAVVVGGQPMIFPVNYRMEQGSVIFRTDQGTKLEGADFASVAFEVDEIGPDERSGWSVMVKGRGYEISDALDHLSEHLRSLDVDSMIADEHAMTVRVIAREITGRLFQPLMPAQGASLRSDVQEPPGSPGDLARHIVARREALGLDRETVAARAGMAPGYLQYIEQRGDARPTRAAIVRLALALETSLEALQGGSIRREGPTRLDSLEESACWEELSKGGVGRAVFDDPRGPVALPVNFTLMGNDVVFMTGEGSIAGAARSRQAMSLEADHLDEDSAEGWSVLAVGTAEEIDDTEAIEAVRGAGLHTWPESATKAAVRIRVRQITGRSLRRHPSD